MDPVYGARGAILGERGKNLYHIEDMTSVKVDIVHDKHRLAIILTPPPNSNGLPTARQMVEDLLDSVYQGYDSWLQRSSGSRDSGQNFRRKKRRLGGGSCDREPRRWTKIFNPMQPAPNCDATLDMPFSHSIDIAKVDKKFHIRGKLLGKGGENMVNITDTSGAVVQLHGESGQEMRLNIGALTEESLIKARSLAEDLVSCTYQMYSDWSREVAKSTTDKSEPATVPSKRTADSLTASVEFFDCDMNFGLRGKVLGNAGSRVRRLEMRTGTVMDVRSPDNKNVTIEIVASSKEKLDDAVRAVKEFREDLLKRYVEWQGQNNPSPNSVAPGPRFQGAASMACPDPHQCANGVKGSKTSKMKIEDDRREFNKVLNLFRYPVAFDVVPRLRGQEDSHLHHIQRSSGNSNVKLIDNPEEPLLLEIGAHSQADLDEAIRQSKDLIQTIHLDYEEWQRDRKRAEIIDQVQDEPLRR